MAPAASDEDNEEFNSPHLPERYRQQVKAKKQRRLKKRLLIAAAVILILAATGLILVWAAGSIFSGLPASSPQHPSPAAADPHLQPAGTTPWNNTTNSTDTFTKGPGLAAPLPTGVIPLDRAVAALRADYPESEFAIRSADLTSGGGRFLYAFTLRPAVDGSGPDVLATLDARTGNTYSPGEETAGISRADARKQALSFFPALHPDRSILVFSSSADSGKQWDFVLYEGDTAVAAGTFDADSGKVYSFFRYLPAEGRPATPAVDTDRARAIADRYIIDKNSGQLPLNMSSVRYQPFSPHSGPVAGQYVFFYERTFQDFLTDMDGFEVIVDAVTGDVTGYTQQWTTPEYAFSASAEPDIIRREATFAVMQKAKEQYPANVAGLRIISAELRWKNRVPYGTIPRPGTIPLAWKVVFDDVVIRANASGGPGIAWVDMQTGNVISFEYRH
jgi:hypothetical protein